MNGFLLLGAERIPEPVAYPGPGCDNLLIIVQHNGTRAPIVEIGSVAKQRGNEGPRRNTKKQ